MVLSDDLMRQLRATFRLEAEEHLQAITRHLLALEQNPPSAERERLLAEIFREAHSLKGAARAVTLEPVEALSHRLETLFSRMQRGAIAPGRAIYDLVFQALDTIGQFVREEAVAVDVAALCDRIESGADHPPPNAAPPEASLPAGIQRGKGVSSTALVAPAPESEPRLQAPEAPARGADETVRVATAKLDSLMAQVGELQVARIGAEQRLAEFRTLLADVEAWEAAWRQLRPRYRQLRLAGAHDGIAPLLDFLDLNETRLRAARAQLADLRRAFESDARRMAQVAADLQADVRRARMVPVASVFDAFPRMVRDLAHERGKQVRLIVQGGETEVDRSMLEQIKAPLMHLLRNSVDHGIELPQARQVAGKPPEGTITLLAAQRGDTILVEVADDGAGVDLERVRAGAIRQGVIAPDAAETLSDRELLWLIFRSGFSTSPAITDISGRGVGLDVVRESVERLNGMLDVQTRPGRGARFSITLPLTVATTLCLLVRAGGETLALPIANVARILRLEPGAIQRAEGRDAIAIDGRPVALARLADALDLDPTLAPPDAALHRPAIVLGSAEKRVAFLVDALIGAQEVVIKTLPRPLMRARNIAGATILGTGEVVMILNVADLLRSAGRSAPLLVAAPASPAPAPAGPPRILVADDSITTRTLEKNILEAAGYRVRTAADGLEAWSLLQSEGCDLLVSDVNMPRLDGFDLAARVRADEQLKHLPIILVTSLDSREDRERGVAAGADAYIVKSAFDQDTLLTAIRQLI